MSDQHVSCVHCPAEDLARLRYDRKGRPYVVCMACGSRSFFHTREALTGTLSLAPQLATLLRSRGQTVDQYRREVLAALDAPAAAAGGGG